MESQNSIHADSTLNPSLKEKLNQFKLSLFKNGQDSGMEITDGSDGDASF